ncbi:hypothetical protein [Muriicola sp. Z0-33]|uniref:hypothetical protein n=1 Tax=Muriicola sp. Z0-33 TaxID=2816957 RepID=UPI00223774BE|nr:hypothetical protein [Muriicola sp. Z0-33]MCW5516401.1 hypothetical protein [Muriicola sp. Z0-33]
MPRNFIRSVRLAVWFVMPFVFTSFVSPFEEGNDRALVEGRYHLTTSDSKSKLLEGAVSFSTAIEISAKGKPFSVIRLDLENNENKKAHSMGFLISKQNWSKELRRGNYKVPVKIKGLIKDFEGVFGFADIKEIGELPFFAENGNINISYVGPELLIGSLEIELKNSEGKLLNINGEFTATRK